MLTTAARPLRLAWIGILVIGSALAYSMRFVQDDAFISFRYARNLAGGHGLVYNAGELVEGYTNFLWTLLMTIPEILRVDPVAFSYFMGLACFAGTLVATRALTRCLPGSETDSLLAPALLASNYSFLCYATGGLETQLQTLLVTTIAWLALDPRSATSRRRTAALSLVSGLAILTRLDSVLFAGPLVLVVCARAIRVGRIEGRAVAGWLGALVAPAGALVGCWLLWKLSYYGAIFPNTALAKGPEPALFRMGLRYLYTFVRSYWLVPVLLVVAFQPRPARATAWRALIAVMGLWSAYVVFAGGDFMEFRLLVPMLPLLFVVIVTALPTDGRVRAALVASIVLGSIAHARSFMGVGPIEPIWNLKAHVAASGDDWPGVGRSIGALFQGADPPVLLATIAAGAVPYYSELPTVDMLGLTDPWVARHGLPYAARPGHRKVASLAYLVERRCNLVLVYPDIVEPSASPCEDPLGIFRHATWPRDVPYASISPDARIVVLPLERGRALRALYLTRHPAIDAAIERGAIRECPFRFEEGWNTTFVPPVRSGRVSH